MEREQLIAAVWDAMKHGPELAAVACHCPQKKMRIVAAIVDRVLWQQTHPYTPPDPWATVRRVNDAIRAQTTD